MGMVQEEVFLIQMSESRRMVSGICETQPPLQEWEDTFSSPLIQGRKEKKYVSSRNHRETIWSQTVTSPLEEPRGSARQPHAVLGTEQGWFNPCTASAVRSGCFPKLAQLLLPLRPQLARAACCSHWMPHA